MIVYRGFALHTEDDPQPWGDVEADHFKAIIDRLLDGTHNDLQAIQGGNADEYYHLTLEQLDKLINIDVESKGVVDTIQTANDVGGFKDGGLLSIEEFGVRRIMQSGSDASLEFGAVTDYIGLRSGTSLIAMDSANGVTINSNDDIDLIANNTGVISVNKPAVGGNEIPQFGQVALIGADEGNGKGYFLKDDDVRENKGIIGAWATDFSFNGGESLTKGATGEFSFATGQEVEASGRSSFATGAGTVASGIGSMSSGLSTVSSGYNSVAIGQDTQASGDQSFSSGIQTIASGAHSAASGNLTTASGIASHAQGLSTIASAPMSHAEGYETTASGNHSHSEGSGSIASQASAHAEGGNTTASGLYSHSEGLGTTASGVSSHAEGAGTTASGLYSHAEGIGTVASANYSHSEGSGTTTDSEASHVEGYGNNITDQAPSGAHCEGSYAIDVIQNQISVTGIGSDGDNRKNGRVLWMDGTEELPEASISEIDARGNKAVATNEFVEEKALESYGVFSAVKQAPGVSPFTKETRTFTILSGWVVRIGWRWVTLPSLSVQLPNTAGDYLIYYEVNTGLLNYSLTMPAWSVGFPIARLVYSAISADEISMGWENHGVRTRNDWFEAAGDHKTVGTLGAICCTPTLIDGGQGTSVLGLSGGEIWDEEKESTVGSKAADGTSPWAKFYYSGLSGGENKLERFPADFASATLAQIRKIFVTDVDLSIGATGRACFNFWNGTQFVPQAIGVNSVMLMHVLANDGILDTSALVIGQVEYTGSNLAQAIQNARAGAASEIANIRKSESSARDALHVGSIIINASGQKQWVDSAQTSTVLAPTVSGANPGGATVPPLSAVLGAGKDAAGNVINNAGAGVLSGDLVNKGQLDTKQNLDATLTAFAGYTGGAGTFPVFTAVDVTPDAKTITATALTLLDDATTSDMRSTLGLPTEYVSKTSSTLQTMVAGLETAELRTTRMIRKSGTLNAYTASDPIVRLTGFVPTNSGQHIIITVSYRGTIYSRSVFGMLATSGLQRFSYEGNGHIVTAKTEAGTTIMEFYSTGSLSGDTFVNVEWLICNDSISTETIEIKPGSTTIITPVDSTVATTSTYTIGKAELLTTSTCNATQAQIWANAKNIVNVETLAMTTAGDIIIGGTSGIPARLAKGSQGHTLVAGATNPEYKNLGSVWTTSTTSTVPNGTRFVIITGTSDVILTNADGDIQGSGVAQMVTFRNNKTSGTCTIARAVGGDNIIAKGSSGTADYVLAINGCVSFISNALDSWYEV